MGWQSKVITYQMLSYLWLFRNSTHSWMALIIALFLLFSSHLLFGFGIFSVLYSSLLVLLSTALFIVSKSKYKSVQVDDHKLVEEGSFSEEESSDQRENIIAVETVTEAKEGVKMDGTSVPNNYSTTTSSPDLLSESECQEQLSSSEDSDEVDWTFQYDDVDHQSSSQDCSDGSISDEESLIEIALPSGHYVEPKYNNYCSMQQKKKTLFCQQSLMEFLSEFNEEENLIEIDISMGSIKYSSRFEIKA